jgi:phage terminase large subunit GpA-like protein
MGAWRPPPRLSLSEWADREFVLSVETSAEPGRWHTLPYQREIMDSITDPEVVQVTLMKSARVGYTLMMSAAMGYYMHQDPSSILVVQPTVDDAKNFSKETVSPMLRDVPCLSKLVFRDVDSGKGPKDPSATLTHKAFPGGVLQLIGANSGAGFRRTNRRVVMFDEVDAYPPSAGSEGDQIELGKKRAEYFHNRKFIIGSTPLTSGSSRIEEQFLEGDQRRYYMPCPTCGHMDFLVFRDGPRGHVMRWPDNQPEEACFECRGNGCVIEHKDQRWMVERGEWRPDNPGGSHRSYHLWSALSYSPNATWGQIAVRFVKAKRGGVEKLKTFINTDLGETWQERGEAPDWERLHQRREPYTIGTVPTGVVVLTAGVDVQKDRLVYEVVGWAPNKESWSIDAGEIHGDTALEASAPGSPWAKLEELLAREFPRGDPETMPAAQISLMAVDSGYSAQNVYGWCRTHPMSRVIATKGASGSARALVGVPSPVDVTVSGRRLQRGYKVWLVGVDLAKSELYGWLRLAHVEADPPAGYCHFPEYDQEFFKQITAEHLVTVANRRTGRSRLEWQVLPNRQNHWLDARILARAAAAVLGIDRLAPRQRVVVPVPVPAAPAAESATSAVVSGSPQRSGFWGRPRPQGGWLGGRRR